ncbi:sperm axonemal maintenance protein CFAP97D1-like [Mercenaria mercenaria]|uniref:sperm axonemal maintenance protein CFAP97D1-like n=1 Tax=Mercenaria mercenaria TaxID=6596 RepID=UPI00234EF5D8|nr:sperm axonemal maintenance protein CFAP97D1-like [Mercenaria mercenaria]
MGAVRPIQPVTPVNNQYLARRWDHEIFNTHRKKVAAAKAVIDNDPPRVHMHLHIKLKKLQFEAERLATIERDNRILLEKMAHIMRSGGAVDNKKEDYHLKSLNKIKRQRELLRITHENLAILKRLMTKDPHYNHKKWNLQWQVNQQYLVNISKYSHPWRQEQSPYISQIERQNMANKLINKKVHSPVKSKTTTPNPGTRSVGRTPNPVRTPVRSDTSIRRTSAKSTAKKTSTPTVDVSETPTVEVSVTPTIEANN